MSRVYNVILTCSFVEADASERVPDAMPGVNSWLLANGHGEMKSIAEHAGGFKSFERFVYMVACNYLDVAAFVAAVKALEWHEPGSLQVFISEPEDEAFRSHLGSAEREED